MDGFSSAAFLGQAARLVGSGLLYNARSIPLLRQFCKKVAIYFVATGAYLTRARGRKTIGRWLQCRNNTTARFVQMAAVVELAMGRMSLDIGHQTGQMHGLNVVQTKFLETG